MGLYVVVIQKKAVWKEIPKIQHLRYYRTPLDTILSQFHPLSILTLFSLNSSFIVLILGFLVDVS
jgi:hypothetical protein